MRVKVIRVRCIFSVVLWVLAWVWRVRLWGNTMAQHSRNRTQPRTGSWFDDNMFCSVSLYVMLLTLQLCHVPLCPTVMQVSAMICFSVPWLSSYEFSKFLINATWLPSLSVIRCNFSQIFWGSISISDQFVVIKMPRAGWGTMVFLYIDESDWRCVIPQTIYLIQLVPGRSIITVAQINLELRSHVSMR